MEHCPRLYVYPMKHVSQILSVWQDMQKATSQGVRVGGGFKIQTGGCGMYPGAH